MAVSASARLEELLADLRGEKRAALKAANPLSDPGGHDGPSAHPSAKDLDDGLMPLRTGFRSSENESDVKKTIPSPNVDETPEGSAKGGEGTPDQDKVQLNIGTSASSTGQDPSVEDDYDGKLPDPGTTHPAKSDMGEKYSALQALPFDKLARATVQLGDELLGDIVNRGKAAGQAAPAPAPSNHAPQAPSPAPVPAAKQAAIAELAEATVKEAAITADLVISFLKRAGDVAPPDAPHKPKPEMGGGPEGGAPGGGPPMDGPQGPPPGGDAGGPPALPPGLGAAAEGGPGMDAPPDAGGPPASPEEAVHELAAAFQDMGMTPEDVMMIAQKMHEAAGAGAPPGGAPMGGPPMGGPPGAPPMGDPAGPKMAAANELYKAANRVRVFRQSGRFIYAPPATKRAASIRRELLATVSDMIRTK